MIGLKQKVQSLMGTLQDEDFNVRLNATLALGEMGKDAVPGLIQALQDENLGVCRSSERALRKIDTSEALKAVEEYQRNKALIRYTRSTKRTRGI